MTDPTQNVGTPSLNPPPPGEPGWLADTPQSTDNYDLVINGVGFMLYRGEDDNPPDRRFKTEPLDNTFAPVFIDRTNTSGDLGDDQQSFYMSFVQRDWSGGLGQKYFRKDTDPQDRMYWEGSRIQTTYVPGEAKLGGNDSAVTSGTPSNFLKILSFTQAAAYTANADIRHCLLKFEGNGNNTILYQYSVDGGVTWNTQGKSGAFEPNAIVDACLGDDGNVYLLDAMSGATTIIHRVSGPIPGTNVTYDSSTGYNGTANCMCYWNGNIYISTFAGRLIQVAFGTISTQTLIKDFGAGIIIDMLPTPRGIYLLYVTVAGEYRIYLYDGTANITQAATLPHGWKTHYIVEGQTTTYPGFGASIPRTQHCMCWQDGVLYVAGMLSARDYQQANGLQTPYRSALYYYASGNSGIVWASEVSTLHPWDCGGSSAIAVVGNGLIAFADPMNQRIMAYDPGTAGVVPLATLTQYPTSTGYSGAAQTVNGTINSLATLLTYNNTANPTPYNVGDVIQCGGTGEKVLVSGVGPSNFTYYIVRGYLNTTPSDATFVNGHTITLVSTAKAPMWGMVYDAEHQRIVIPWDGYDGAFTGGAWGNTAATSGGDVYDAGYTIIDLRPGPDFGGAASGVMASSMFDFDSSLVKYFKDVMWNGDLTQFPNLNTETAGTVDLYYCVDSIAANTTDAGVTLVQAGAVPGTRYNIGAQGHTLQILLVLHAPGGSSSHPISQGPILRWLAVRGAPIQPFYRYRNYQVALFSKLPLKNGMLEPRTPNQLHRNLESLMTTGAPVTVSDETMTNVSCIIEADQCTFREMKPGEWVAYVAVREV